MATLISPCAKLVQRVAFSTRASVLGTVLLLSFSASARSAEPLLTEYRTPAPISSLTSWASHNRFVEVFGGQRQQNYREADTQALTSTGTLDTETGAQSHAGIALRWQTDAGFLVHLQAQRQSDTTDYNGYLQAGNGSLTPYRARTGNTATQLSVNLGYALNANTLPAVPTNWQITPLVQLGQHRWERNLVQYSEAYAYNTNAIGALVQWQVTPGTLLELQGLSGRTQSASVSAASLNFAAEQPGGSLREWQWGISQDLASLTGKDAFAGWMGTARYTESQYEHGASPIVNSLQAPPNQHKPSVWTLGVQRLF